MEMGESNRSPTWEYKMGEHILMRRKEEEDQGVVIQDNLTPQKTNKWVIYFNI